MKKHVILFAALVLLMAFGACTVQVEAEGAPTEPTTTQAPIIAQPPAQNELLDSFMANLDAVKVFLGTPELEMAEEDIIVLQENLVTAQGKADIHDVRLVLRHHMDHEDKIQWILLEYGISGIGGPGFLDAGRSRWYFEQERLFNEAFTMRFYNHKDNWPEPVYDYYDEEISPEGWRAQVIDHMKKHTGIQLSDIWYEESRLVADVIPASAIYFNWGSSGGGMRQRSLIDSLASMPNVSEIVVLVGGQRGVNADHFSFAEVFKVN